MQIAAYYFPNYHLDSRNEEFHGPGWTEWELMKVAHPRFAGHRQPRIPLWGYEDEADPRVMAKKIDAASEAGLDAFVFDWYWYESKPYLWRALDEGFLQAPNRNRLKFALMWANHDWYDRHPIGFRASSHATLLYPWNATREEMGSIWDMLLRKYFLQPNYWKIEGRPYFSIYAVDRFIRQMGGTQQAAEILELLQKKAREAGLPGIHLTAIWYDNLENRMFCICPQTAWTQEVGFHTYTSYNSIGTTQCWQEGGPFPTVDYSQASQEYAALAKHALETLPAPYYPVVTAGWDSTPRTIQSEVFQPGPYPWIPVMEPDAAGFGQALQAMGALLKNRPPEQQLLFLNAWNEWTEGSYLEPDTVLGTSYLNTLRDFSSTVR